MDKHELKVYIVAFWHLFTIQVIGLILVSLRIHEHMNLFNFPNWIMILWIAGVSLALSLIVNVPLWPERKLEECF